MVGGELSGSTVVAIGLAHMSYAPRIASAAARITSAAARIDGARI